MTMFRYDVAFEQIPSTAAKEAQGLALDKHPVAPQSMYTAIPIGLLSHQDGDQGPVTSVSDGSGKAVYKASYEQGANGKSALRNIAFANGESINRLSEHSYVFSRSANPLAVFSDKVVKDVKILTDGKIQYVDCDDNAGRRLEVPNTVVEDPVNLKTWVNGQLQQPASLSFGASGRDGSSASPSSQEAADNANQPSSVDKAAEQTLVKKVAAEIEDSNYEKALQDVHNAKGSMSDQQYSDFLAQFNKDLQAKLKDDGFTSADRATFRDATNHEKDNGGMAGIGGLLDPRPPLPRLELDFPAASTPGDFAIYDQGQTPADQYVATFNFEGQETQYNYTGAEVSIQKTINPDTGLPREEQVGTPDASGGIDFTYTEYDRAGNPIKHGK